MRRTDLRILPWVLVASLACAPGLSGVSAHEIPSDVTIQIIAKPLDQRFHLLVRAPLEAMQDISFPTIDPGYLDFEQAEQALRNAALLWLAGDIELYENEERTSPARLIAVRASIPSNRAFTDYDSALAALG